MTLAANGNYSADYTESYVVGGTTPESHQYMAVFLPDAATWPKPSAGYPLFLFTSYGGFATASHGTTIPYTNPAILMWRLLSEFGCAVAWVGMTGTYDSIGGPVNTTSVGRGLFHPPGTTGWSDDTRYSAQKEAILAVQLARYRASTWGIDPSRMVASGESAGTCAWSAPAFWPDQADGGESDHRQESSRILGVHFKQAQHDFAIYDDSVSTVANFNCFPSASGDITQDLATTFADAPTSPENYLRWASAFQVGFDSTAARARIDGELHVWTHAYGAGNHMASMALTGSYGASSAKTPVAAGTVDANDTGALHESGQPHLMIQGLREIQAGTWHTDHSVLLLDTPEYSYVTGVDSGLAEQVSLVRANSTFLATLLDVEMRWLESIFYGVGGERLMTYTAPGGDLDLDLTATLKASDGTTYESGTALLHRGSGLYSADLPSQPPLPADFYTYEVYESSTLLHTGTIAWGGAGVLGVEVVDSFNVSPEYPVRASLRRRGVDTDARSGMSQRRVTFQSVGVDSDERSVRYWRIQWAMATETDAARVWELFETTYGGAMPMLFAPPNENAAAVRFVEDQLSISRVGPNQYAMTVELEEVTNA